MRKSKALRIGKHGPGREFLECVPKFQLKRDVALQWRGPDVKLSNRC